jgi:amidase
MARNLAWEIDHHREEISPALRNGRLQDGLNCTYEHYREMLARMERCQRLLDAVFAEHDVLLAPAAAGEAPVGMHPVPHPWVYMMWTATHVPSVTLPVFRGPAGLPVGAQLIARRREDRKLFAAARWVHRQLA